MNHLWIVRFDADSERWECTASDGNVVTKPVLVEADSDEPISSQPAFW